MMVEMVMQEPREIFLLWENTEEMVTRLDVNQGDIGSPMSQGWRGHSSIDGREIRWGEAMSIEPS